MTETVLGIYNAAISAAEGRGRLDSLSERSREREECDIWYDLVRDTVQEASFWPSSRASSRLTLLSSAIADGEDWVDGMPEAPYLYSYLLPQDCLRPWHLTNYMPFQLSFNGDNTIMSTNATQPVLVYARKNNTPVQWTPGQRKATVLGLAAMICPGINGSSQRQSMNYQLANQILLEAQANALNSSMTVFESMPPEIQARGYLGSPETQYYYPFGQLFAVGTV